MTLTYFLSMIWYACYHIPCTQTAFKPLPLHFTLSSIIIYYYIPFATQVLATGDTSLSNIIVVDQLVSIVQIVIDQDTRTDIKTFIHIIELFIK